jgi:hypothetical protein
MDAKALPSELLDEKELNERFRAIDEAVFKVRRDIELLLGNDHKTVKVKPSQPTQ